MTDAALADAAFEKVARQLHTHPTYDLRQVFDAGLATATRLRTPVTDNAEQPVDVDAICDEAVRLAEQEGTGRTIWQAAYHATMATRAALASQPKETELLRDARDVIATLVCERCNAPSCDAARHFLTRIDAALTNGPRP